MAVTLRLQRLGKHKRPFYRIVATDHQSPRDGRFLEILGTYDALTEPPTVVIKEDRVRARLKNGAKFSNTMAGIIKAKMPGELEQLLEARTKKIQQRRKARKQRSPKKAKK